VCVYIYIHIIYIYTLLVRYEYINETVLHFIIGIVIIYILIKIHKKENSFLLFLYIINVLFFVKSYNVVPYHILWTRESEIYNIIERGISIFMMHHVLCFLFYEVKKK